MLASPPPPPPDPPGFYPMSAGSPHTAHGHQLDDFWPIQKFTIFWHSFKPAQKVVEVDIWPPLGRPMSPFYDFGINFNVIFGTFFHQYFDVCSKVAKMRKCYKTNTFFMIFAFLSFLSLTKIRSKFLLIFRAPSKTTF